MADKTYPIGYLEKETKSGGSDLVAKKVILTTEQLLVIATTGTLTLNNPSYNELFSADLITIYNSDNQNMGITTLSKIIDMDDQLGVSFTGVVEALGTFMYFEVHLSDTADLTFTYKKVIQNGKRVVFPTLSSISGYAVSLDGTVQTISINTKIYDNVSILSYTIPNSISLAYDNTKGILLSKIVENNSATYLFYVKDNLTFTQRP